MKPFYVAVGQISMLVVDTRVNHPDDDVLGSGGEIPGLGRIDIRIVRTGGLPHFP